MAVVAEAGVVEADASEVDAAEAGVNLVYMAVCKIVSGRNILSRRICHFPFYSTTSYPAVIMPRTFELQN